MATLSLGKAARLVGLGKTTLARAIKAGRLSATRRPDGSYEVDTAELLRVWPPAGPEAVAGETGRDARTPAHRSTVERTTDALAAEVAGLRQVEALLREQVADLKTDRDKWREQAETAQRLLGGPGERRSWWSRLKG